MKKRNYPAIAEEAERLLQGRVGTPVYIDGIKCQIYIKQGFLFNKGKILMLTRFWTRFSKVIK